MSLSAQELRRKRLAALMGGATVNLSSSDAATSSTAKSSIQVVDLCNDSSDDDDVSDRKPAAAPSSSSSDGVISIESDNDDEALLLKQFYQQKKKRKENDENQGQPAKKPKRSAAKRPTNNGQAASTRPTAAKTVKKTSGTSTSMNFQVATWNVWFGSQNLPAGEPHASARMKALARHLLRSHNPDSNNPLVAIGFQEVIDELAVHLFPLLENAGYQIFRQPGSPAYGCALAIFTNGETNSCTLLDASWQPYQDTQMARGFLYARIQLASCKTQVLFTTTHLESWCGADATGARERQVQLQELESFCNQLLTTYPSLKTAIMTGDMNWDDERVRANAKGNDPVMATVLQSPLWQDSFLTTRQGKKQTCYTYDSKLNPMLGGNLRRRFDRCLVRNSDDASSGAVESIGTKLVGTEALVSLTWQKYSPYKQTYKEMPTALSDHFGLVVQMASTT